MPELSYGECLRIGWFLLWRGSVLSFVVFALGAIVLELVVTVFGPLREYMLVLYVSATLGVVTFGIYPWLVRMMLWKPFRGFRWSSFVMSSRHEGRRLAFAVKRSRC